MRYFLIKLERTDSFYCPISAASSSILYLAPLKRRGNLWCATQLSLQESQLTYYDCKLVICISLSLLTKLRFTNWIFFPGPPIMILHFKLDRLLLPCKRYSWHGINVDRLILVYMGQSSAARSSEHAVVWVFPAVWIQFFFTSIQLRMFYAPFPSLSPHYSD